jgi:acyl dehydratase
MGDPLTNGWLQLAIAAGALLGLICFAVALQSGTLRFPKPQWS